MKKGKWVGWIIIGVLAFTAFIFVLVTGTQYLWNWLVPALFAGPVITFWQTAGLLLLSKIILWPIGKGNRCSHHGGPWKNYWKEKWTNMTPEEREKLKQKMKEKWCYKETEGTSGESGSSNV
jgi:hypothetical protein